MNWGASECSSGCESGWTMYLDHSSLSSNPREAGGGFGHPLSIYGNRGKDAKEDDGEEEKEEEEEDMSMVSDASSGPPHFHQDQDCDYHYDENPHYCSPVFSAAAIANKSGKRRKVQEHHQQQHPSSFLDDTASSPILGLSKNKLSALTENQASGENVFSQGFSGNYFKGKSSFQKHFSFLNSEFPEKSSSSAKTSGNAVVSSLRP